MTLLCLFLELWIRGVLNYYFAILKLQVLGGLFIYIFMINLLFSGIWTELCYVFPQDGDRGQGTYGDCVYCVGSDSLF